jgi:ABC-2 type transport system ATP-binding protein
VHPRFDRAKAEAFLAKTNIPRDSRVHKLSKGMITQLHLALVMAIDARLLVLDEPTLGLDILYRKAFYDTLLNDYFDHSRTILVTTHQVEEIQHVLTDVMFINKGRLVLDCSMEDFREPLRRGDGAARADRRGAARSSRCTSGRCSAAAYSSSIAPTARRSPRSARRARPALQTCSSP